MTQVRSYNFEVYQAADGHRWHLKAPNGKLIADSGEAYHDAAAATRSVNRLKKVLATREVVVSTITKPPERKNESKQ